MKPCAAASTEVIGCGGVSPSLFILPERSIASNTSVGTSQLRNVFAIGSGHVNTAVWVLLGAKSSIKVREEVRAFPFASKMVATTSASFTLVSALL